MKDEDGTAATKADVPTGSFGIGYGRLDLAAAIAWAAVGLPLAWGVYRLLDNAVKIFS
jgi:hypothetical protein